MTLEGSSALAIIMFIMFFLIALSASYLYGWKAIETTGWFGSQVFISSVINLFLCACAIFGWFLYSWDINESVFFGGLMLGATLFVVSEAALITIFFVRRDKLVESYHDQTGHSLSEQE